MNTNSPKNRVFLIAVIALLGVVSLVNRPVLSHEGRVADSSQPVASNSTANFVANSKAAFALAPVGAITVNTTADGPLANDGNCTLREAITNANNDNQSGSTDCAAGSGADTITFSVTGTINLTGALPSLSSSMTIQGPGANNLMVRRNTAGDYRIFAITSGVTTISGLTISNGSSSTSSGGGIQNSGTLTIESSTVSANTAYQAGGIYNIGTLTIRNSTVSGNTALSDVGGVWGNGGALTIQNSTVSGNNAANFVGGVATVGGSLTIQNSTVSGNSAGYEAGGIYIQGGPNTLTSVTVTNNRADSDNNNSGTGGGLRIYSATTLQNTIVAGNLNENGATDAPDDISADVNISGSFNLIGTGGAGGLTNGTNNNQVGVANPGLGPLANNGGATQTHALLTGSPAIDKGSAFGLTTDQRGSTRPANDPSISNASDGSDIGAFEVALCSTPATPTITPGGSASFCVSGTLTSSSATGNQWYKNGNLLSGETNQTYLATANGSYTVTVTDTGCTSAASAATVVTINSNPATPTITPGGPTTFCQGGSVTLTSSSGSGNQWSVNGNPIGGATSQTYAASSSGTYTVKVTDGNGCTGAASAGTTVTVNPLPATPTITPSGATTFCAGGSVTLTSSSASGNQWYLNGNPIGGATNQTVVASSSGNYSVTVTANGCASAPSSSTTVTVNPTPATPTITPGGPTTFCQGGSVTLNSSSASGNQWYLNGNPIGGATSQTYVSTATGNYTVKVTDGNSCQSPTSGATSVTVNPLPATPTITPGGATTFCAGGSVTLTSSSASGNQWYLNGNPIGGSINQTFVASATGNYTVQVTDGNSCQSAPSGATSVTVNPTPATPTITPGGATTFCAGGSVTLTSSSASGNQWYLNGNPIGGSINQTFVASATGNYTVQVTDGNSCHSAPSGATSVTVNPTPATPTITPGGPTTFCAGGSVTLTSSSVSGNQWYLNGNPIGGSTNQTYVATATGNYTVLMTDGNSCQSASSGATSVTVNPIPSTPTITPSGSTATCDSLLLTSSSASGNQWYLNGDPIGGATSQTYSATASGNYTVVVTASGCSSAHSAAASVTLEQSAATVTNTNDSGAGSLRDAIANVCVGGTINFDPSLNGQTTTLTSGELLIDKDLTIAGPGADLLTVMRSPAVGTPDFRIFSIIPGKTVSISGLTINNGKTTGDGAGINNQGNLSLSSCAVTGNQSTQSGGGALNDAGGTLVITASTISGNTGTAAGGGIANGGTLTIINSTISGNTGDGLSNNNIANLTNDTFSDNSVRGVTSNGGATTNVRNTIVANTPGSAGDVAGAFNSQGNNLIGKLDGSNGFTVVNNDKVGTVAFPLNALLAVLGNYGGPTQTHALLPGSPASDVADNCVTDPAHCGDASIPQLTVDQRGFGRQVNSTVDIGAFESRGFTIAITGGNLQSAAINTAFGAPLLATVSSATSEPTIGGQVVFTAPTAGASATFSGGVTTINATINASGQASASATANGTAGGPYTVSVAGNGISNTANFSLTNSKGGQTINFGPIASKTFGDPDFTVSATATSGQAVSLVASGNCTVTSPSPGTVHITGAGSCTITASQAGDANYDPAANVPQSFTISKAGQTITFGALANKTFGNPDFQISATSSSGLAVSLSAAGNCIVNSPSPGMVHLTAAGPCTITASQAGNIDYLSAPNVPQTFTINKANQAINFAVLASKTFGDSDFTVSATATSGQAVSLVASGNCTVTSPSPGTVHITGAGSCTITASQAGDANYDPAANVPQSFTINKANQTINFAALANKTFGDPDFAVSATATSGLSVGFAASGSCSSPSAGTVHLTGAGSCTITASQTGNTNFNAAPDALQSFTINKVNQTITFGPITTRTFGDADFAVSPTATSGLAVSLVATGNCAVTSASPGTVHITGAGSCVITASQAGNANFNGAPAAPQSFTISKANQTINFGALTDKTFGDANFGISAAASSGLSVNFVAGGNCTVNSPSPGTVYLTGAGSCTITASQAGNIDNNAAPDLQRSFNIAKANTSTAVSSSVNPSDFGESVTFTATISSGAGTPTGTVQFKDSGTNLGAPATLNASGVAQLTVKSAATGNHNLTAEYSGSGNFNISTGTLSGGQVVKAQPTLSINDVSITEGQAGTKVLNFTVTLSAASTLTVTANFGTANGTATAGSDYVATNGTLTFNPGDLTRTIPVTINGDTGFEPDETFTVALTAPTNASLNKATGTGTIQNDEAQGGLISFSGSNTGVNEIDGIVTLTVVRTNDVSQAATVDYATDDTGAPSNCGALNTNLASQRCDYTAMFGTLKFAANETQKTIDIPISLDGYTEGPENFTVKLTNPTGGAVLATPSTATVTINDSTPPSSNPLDDTASFVRQQYRDFLNRDADPAGLAFWKDNIDKCTDPARLPAGQTVLQCIEIQRLNTSAAFFLSIEFQQTGNFVRSVYVAALDRPLTNNMEAFMEFERDTQAVQRGVIVGQGNWQQTLDNNRDAFIRDFVARAEFVGLYPTTDTPTQYVDNLYAHAAVTPANPAERAAAIAEFGAANTAADAGARGRALLRITQNPGFQSREINRSFVQMEYFGYLRRNPNDAPDADFSGYDFWVNKLNAAGGNYITSEMVKAFLASTEYRQRFGP